MKVIDSSVSIAGGIFEKPPCLVIIGTYTYTPSKANATEHMTHLAPHVGKPRFSHTWRKKKEKEKGRLSKATPPHLPEIDIRRAHTHFSSLFFFFFPFFSTVSLANCGSSR